MKKFLALVTFLFIVTGCMHDLSIVQRDGGPIGIGQANESGKKVEINLNGKTYRGTYVHGGGSAIFTSSSVTISGIASGAGGSGIYSGSTSSFGSGYVEGSGNGKMLVLAEDGDALRCEFLYKGGSGLGVCQDNEGELYDLIIHN